MIKTDLKQQLRDMIYLSRTTHKELGERLGVTDNAIARLISRQTPDALSPATVKLFEVLGYDLEIKFVKRSVANPGGKRLKITPGKPPEIKPF